MAHIFIADDDPLDIDLLNFKLKRAGHEVSHSGDGEVAMLELLANPVDLVILDMLMPGIDGIEFIHQPHNIWRVQGWWQFVRKQEGWGEMTRLGLRRN